MANNLINESASGGGRYGVRAESPGATYLTSAARTCNACGWPSTETCRQRRTDEEREREGEKDEEGERKGDGESRTGWRVKIPWSSP